MGRCHLLEGGCCTEHLRIFKFDVSEVGSETLRYLLCGSISITPLVFKGAAEDHTLLLSSSDHLLDGGAFRAAGDGEGWGWSDLDLYKEEAKKLI